MTNLPTNIDASYTDVGDPARQLHQQHHDEIHQRLKGVIVNHGATAGTARPVNAQVVIWVGTVAPTNKASGDYWRDPTADTEQRWTGSAWTQVSATLADITAAINALKGGVGPAYDTLVELASALTSDESVAAALATKVAGKVDYAVHGSTAGTARPSGATVVLWIGSVNPTNAATNDFLWNTSSKLLFRYTGSAWDQHGSGTYLPVKTYANALVAPYYSAHRGGANVFPEQTMEAYSEVLAYGTPFILDADCGLSLDNVPVLMHDDTLDRVTNGTGNLSAITLPELRALRVDAENWLGGGGSTVWTNVDLRVATFQDLISRYGGKHLLAVEAKTVSAVAPMAQIINAAGIRDSIVVFCDDDPTRDAILAAGLLCGMSGFTTSAAVTAAAAAGVYYCSIGWPDTNNLLPVAVADSRFTFVGTHVLNRRSDRAAALALGVDIITSDDPVYLARSTPLTTSVDFTKGRWGHGWNYVGTRPALDGAAGVKYGPGTTNDAFVIGSLGPITATTFTVTAVITVDTLPSTVTRNVIIGLLDSDIGFTPTQANTANGYTNNLYANGQLKMFQADKSPAASTQIAISSGDTALTTGQTLTVTVTVTPTTITFTRTDTGKTISATNSVWRPAGGFYVHFMKTGGTGADGVWHLKSVTVT